MLRELIIRLLWMSARLPTEAARLVLGDVVASGPIMSWQQVHRMSVP